MTSTALNALTCIQPDTWLSHQMQCPAFIIGCPEEHHVADVRQFLAAEGHCFATMRTATSDVRAVNLAEDMGFRVVDVNVTCERSTLEPIDTTELDYEVRSAIADDERDVVVLTAQHMTGSRFHLDPLIEPATASRIKESWARNYFRGERGDAMIVARQHNRLAGVLLALTSPHSTFTTDLIVVHPDHRGQGLPRVMTHAMQCALPGVQRLRIGTQTSNISAMRCYARLGYEVVSTQYVLHYHGRSSFGD